MSLTFYTLVFFTFSYFLSTNALYISNESIIYSMKELNETTELLIKKTYDNSLISKYDSNGRKLNSLTAIAGGIAWTISSVLTAIQVTQSKLAVRRGGIYIKNWLCNDENSDALSTILPIYTYTQSGTLEISDYPPSILQGNEGFALFEGSEIRGSSRFRIGSTSSGFDIGFKICQSCSESNYVWIDFFIWEDNKSDNEEIIKNNYYSIEGKAFKSYAIDGFPMQYSRINIERGGWVTVECTIGNAYHSDVICLVYASQNYEGCKSCNRRRMNELNNTNTTNYNKRQLIELDNPDPDAIANGFNLMAAAISAGTTFIDSYFDEGNNREAIISIENFFSNNDLLLFQYATRNGFGYASTPCQRIRSGIKEQCKFTEHFNYLSSNTLFGAVRYRIQNSNIVFDIYFEVTGSPSLPNGYGIITYTDFYHDDIANLDVILNKGGNFRMGHIQKQCNEANMNLNSNGINFRVTQDCSKQSTLNIQILPSNPDYHKSPKKCDASF